MKKHYDVIIIGAGAMGVSTGYFAAGKGLRVLMLDAYNPPHTKGSHHGDTRIIRHAYAEGKSYVPMVLRAQQLWEELEAATKNHIFSRTGVLSVGDPSFLTNIQEAATSYCIPIERMTSSEMMKHWSGLRVSEGIEGVFEQGSGVLFADRCILSYKQLALAEGADVVTNCSIDTVDLSNQGCRVSVDGEIIYADHLVVSVGAWLRKMLGRMEVHINLSPRRKVVGWFHSEDHAYDDSHFPAFDFVLPKGTYYGIPSIDGSGVKVGRHDGGEIVDPDSCSRDCRVYEPELEGSQSFINRHLPKLSTKVSRSSVCLYAMTEDEHFIIDHLRSHPHVHILGGFSAHGFKFSSVVGEMTALRILHGDCGYDMSTFSLYRPSVMA